MKTRIAVLLPCYNEELSIGQTVAKFKQVLPDAEIYVCDNNSTDQTSVVAKNAGAQVIFEGSKGKGQAVKRLFREVEADLYVMSDGDLTYEAEAAPKLIQLLQDERLDMVVGRRVEFGEGTIYRVGHRFGNQAFNTVLKQLFGAGFNDIFSGYRIFSKRFVKSFPVWAKGFEIESELAIHCLSLGLSFKEVDTRYSARIEGSQSKLNKYRDGIKILTKILRLYLIFKPLQFFGLIGFFGYLSAFAFLVPVVLTYLETGLVPRFPTLIVATSVILLSSVFLVLGFVLHFLARARMENRMLAYLAVK